MVTSTSRLEQFKTGSTAPQPWKCLATKTFGLMPEAGHRLPAIGWM
jgi:hypothetical protein